MNSRFDPERLFPRLVGGDAPAPSTVRNLLYDIQQRVNVEEADQGIMAATLRDQSRIIAYETAVLDDLAGALSAAAPGDDQYEMRREPFQIVSGGNIVVVHYVGVVDDFRFLPFGPTGERLGRGMIWVTCPCRELAKTVRHRGQINYHEGGLIQALTDLYQRCIYDYLEAPRT